MAHFSRTQLTRTLAAGAVTIMVAAGGSACGSGAAAGSDGDPIEGISEDLIDAAKAEGGVVLYAGGHTRDQLDQLKASFEARYGITLTFARTDSGSTVNAVNSELAGGNLDADVVSVADPSAMQAWADDDVLASYDLATQDQIPTTLDEASTPQVPFAVVPLGIMHNSNDLPESDVPATWQGLAASNYLTVTADPSASGSALAFYTVLREELGEEWFAEIGSTDPIVTESTLGLNQLVLTGEADLGIPALESTVLATAAEGEPLSIVYPEGPVPATTLLVAGLADAPHPAAAELLMRFQLSEEFQEELGEGGTRGVLEGLPVPEGAPELDAARIRTVPVETISAEGDSVKSAFNGEIK